MLRKSLGLVFALSLLVMLTSCSFTESSDKVVINTFHALKANDLQPMSKYIDVEELKNLGDVEKKANETSDEVFKDIFSNLTAKVISTKIDKDKAVVKTEVTNIDMKSVFGKYIVQAFATAFSNMGNTKSESETNAETEKLMLDTINSETATVTNTVDT